MKRVSKPALTLMAITPFLTELLSGNMPPQQFFFPVIYLVFVVLYGLPALVIREIAVRRDLGWGGIFILGLAYGIVNEGIAAKTLLLGQNVPMPSFDSYGYVMGVNFTWSPVITIWHALHAVVFPIALLYVLYPEKREEAWLSTRLVTVLGALSLVMVVLLFFRGGDLHPSPVYLVAFGVVILALGVFSLRKPQLALLERHNHALGRPLIIGFGLVVVAFILLLLQSPQVFGLIGFYLQLAIPATGITILGLLYLHGTPKSAEGAGRERGQTFRPVLLGFSFTLFWIASLVLSAAKVNLVIFYLYLALAFLFFVHLLKKHNWLSLPDIALVGLGVYMSSGLFAIISHLVRQNALGVLVEVLLEIVLFYAAVRIRGRQQTIKLQGNA